MSVWQLNRDILHCVYAEWLVWRDLSVLDVACVGKEDREAWLSSLASLRKTNSFMERGFSDRKGMLYSDKIDQCLFDEAIKRLYGWLASRRVFCVEGFPLRLPLLEEVQRFHCPALQSIVIEQVWFSSSYSSQVERLLSVFLAQCNALRGLALELPNMTEEEDPNEAESDGDISETVLLVLVESLREKSLSQIALWGSAFAGRRLALTTILLSKHASSLQEINLRVDDGVEAIMSALLENQIHLKVLNVFLPGEDLQSLDSLLLPYLSSAGDLLETLQVECCSGSYFDIEHILIAVAASCPKLACLVMRNVEPCSVEILRHLYEHCPLLQDLFIEGTITAHHTSSVVSMTLSGSSEDWAACLSHALARSPCKEVMLRLEEDYDPVPNNLQSVLEPYRICLSSSAPEASLVALLNDLPNLKCLCLQLDVATVYTDATLSAIKAHTKSLVELCSQISSFGRQAFKFSDKMLSEVIEACQQLKSLTVHCCGLQSLLAVSKHSSLRMVCFPKAQPVYKKAVERLLLDEEVVWPDSLQKGYFCDSQSSKCYQFNQESHKWTVNKCSNTATGRAGTKKRRKTRRFL
eukprot:scaffold1016_cov175-Ochromonas_danica.AAC.6